MDTLTHTVLGACTGQIIAGKQIGKKAMLIGALINNFPDLDMIANLWHSPAESLLSHRGITHSFFFMILSIPVLIWLFRLIFPSAILSWTRWFFLIVHGLALHILLVTIV
jgi:inner membrane protein